jgi:hypothetical protein
MHSLVAALSKAFSACVQDGSWTLRLIGPCLALLAISFPPSTAVGTPTTSLCPYAITYAGGKIRYCRNRALSASGGSPAVTRAIIFIHGAGRNAPDYYADRMIDALDAIPTGGGNPINQVATVVQTARNHQTAWACY